MVGREREGETKEGRVWERGRGEWNGKVKRGGNDFLHPQFRFSKNMSD